MFTAEDDIQCSFLFKIKKPMSKKIQVKQSGVKLRVISELLAWDLGKPPQLLPQVGGEFHSKFPPQ